MFLRQTIKKNPKLIEAVMNFHQRMLISPDTYVIDVDHFLSNARLIADEAAKYNIELYFMLKQIGRNPYLAKELMKLGYAGAVVVDFKEAKVMMKHNVPIANVGHLVQPNRALIQELVDYGCEYFTVYSLEKMNDINEAAKKSNKVQKVLIRVYDEGDLIYSGQTAGFALKDLKENLSKMKEFENIQIAGLTSFPCYLYSEETNDIEATSNLNTVLKAKKVLEDEGIEVININTPSTTSVKTIQKMAKINATSGEPGHGLSGTTPLHTKDGSEEIPSVVYLSEVSHNFEGKAYIFGGGYYRRGHAEKVLVGKNIKDSKIVNVLTPDLDSIDYHFGLSEECEVNDTAIMAFRFQIFVTRSDVCLMKGLIDGNPEIIGLYTALGEQIHE